MLLLKECGADLNAVDHSGFSALDLAALCGHKTLVARLLAESEVHHMGEEGPHVRLRQRVEDFCETAKSFQQRDELNEINQLVCMPLAVQSFAASQ
ncbi:unnamed protein product [Phytomonas sp. EM1]|nr:unnamed protein product [Phytomonas sp. EM1]|eukprot:CCW63405.1 unnamed protein product [Phytomonas sp. isolate EM1]